MKRLLILAAALGVLAASAAHAQPSIEAQLDALDKRVTRLEDANAVEKLQRAALSR